MKRRESMHLAQAAMIASLYVTLTFLSNMLGLWEVRLSEALCILPFFTAAAVPGLTVGCVLANLLTGCALWDIVLGSAATFIGAYAARKLHQKSWLLAPWPNIIANTAVIPLVLKFVYLDNSRTLAGFYAYMAVSEIVSAGLLGYFLLKLLEKHRHIFHM